jgi:hypothetical protein
MNFLSPKKRHLTLSSGKVGRNVYSDHNFQRLNVQGRKVQGRNFMVSCFYILHPDPNKQHRKKHTTERYHDSRDCDLHSGTVKKICNKMWPTSGVKKSSSSGDSRLEPPDVPSDWLYKKRIPYFVYRILRRMSAVLVW